MIPQKNEITYFAPAISLHHFHVNDLSAYGGREMTCRVRSFYISFAKITMRKAVPTTFTSTQGIQLLKYQVFSASTRKWFLASDLYGKMEGTVVLLPDFPVFWHALASAHDRYLGDAI